FNLWYLVIVTNEQRMSGIVISTDPKYYIEWARKHGVHVSPTVFGDGFEEPEISSR
ncbi:unnamed protein product, partial [Rotaria sp. Silwood2]